MPTVATVGSYHSCPANDGGHAHKGGVVLSGSNTVFIRGMAACRVGDPCQCDSPNPDHIKGGSTSVFIDGKAAVRVGDPTEHGGKVEEGVDRIQFG